MGTQCDQRNTYLRPGRGCRAHVAKPSHFTEEETKAQRRDPTCPESHSKLESELPVEDLSPGTDCPGAHDWCLRGRKRQRGAEKHVVLGPSMTLSGLHCLT